MKDLVSEGFANVVKPYIDTVNQTLTNDLEDEIKTRVELGAHQLLKYTLESLKANNTSGTWNDNAYTVYGVTFTLNDDLTITATGTASAQIDFMVHYVSAHDVFLKANTSYIASIYDGKGSNSTFKLVTYGRNASAQTTFDIVSLDCDGQEIKHAQTSVGIQFSIRIMPNFNTNGIVFKPLLKFGADSSNEFTPYAMTNRELTVFADLANKLVSNGALRDITDDTLISSLTNGVYRFPSSRPSGLWVGYGVLVLILKNNNSTGIQIAFKMSTNADISTNHIAVRLSNEDTWSNWTRIVGTNQT